MSGKNNETSGLKPANPDYESVVRASFARQGLMGTLGAWLVEVTPGRVVIELPFSSRISQQHGHFHGGAIGAVGDTAGGYAALTLMPAGSDLLTVEYKINFVRPASGARLRAEGQVVRAGRSLSVTRASVLCGNGDELEPCALLQQTMLRITGD